MFQCDDSCFKFFYSDVMQCLKSGRRELASMLLMSSLASAVWLLASMFQDASLEKYDLNNLVSLLIITRLLKDNLKCLVSKQPKPEDKKDDP